MDQPRIAVLDDYGAVARASADWRAVERRAAVTFFPDHLDDRAALRERLAPFDAICVMRERTVIDADLLAELPRLRFIGSTGPRNVAIDVAAARARGITVSTTGAHPTGTPELTWALILAAARALPAETASVRDGAWQRGLGTDLAGATLGLVGLGRIGTRVAAVARAFGMDVLGWSQNLTADAAVAAGATRVDKHELLRRADFVSLHLVLSDRTRGILGADDLAQLRPHAWLVNTSRGPLVDEAALLAALRAGRIAGAALDVFDREPLPPDHPFRTLPNVIATPHIGYATRDTFRVFFRDTVENLLAWLDGTPTRVSE